MFGHHSFILRRYFPPYLLNVISYAISVKTTTGSRGERGMMGDPGAPGIPGKRGEIGMCYEIFKHHIICSHAAFA